MSNRFTLSNIDPAFVATECSRALAMLATAIPKAYLHEVGSTAVPGVVGKQDIDILVRVPADEFNAYAHNLA